VSINQLVTLAFAEKDFSPDDRGLLGQRAKRGRPQEVEASDGEGRADVEPDPEDRL